jgi:hypothetical protein
MLVHDDQQDGDVINKKIVYPLVNQQNDIEIPWLFPWKNDQMVVFTCFSVLLFSG